VKVRRCHWYRSWISFVGTWVTEGVHPRALSARHLRCPREQNVSTHLLLRTGSRRSLQRTSSGALMQMHDSLQELLVHMKVLPLQDRLFVTRIFQGNALASLSQRSCRRLQQWCEIGLSTQKQLAIQLIVYAFWRVSQSDGIVTCL